MAVRDQLEVISPTGEILFFDLDMSDGLTNIGRHPSNNVALPSPAVADFHLVVDHRSLPYQVGVLAQDGPVTVGGQPVRANEYHPLQPWDTIELAGYIIILVAGEAPAAPPPPSQPAGPLAAPPPVPSPMPVGPGGIGATVLQPVAPLPVPPAAASPANGPQMTAAAPVAAALPPIGTVGGNGAAPVQAPQAQLNDLIDEVIVLDVSARQVAIDVEQTATWQLSIANGGALVARFDVRLEGWIDAAWVTIQPALLNLFEGGRGAATVTVTPPRRPTSRAGDHVFAIVVTSPNYPGRVARRVVTLTINPYYDYNVGEISPRQQTVTYFRKSGRLRLPIHNRGNSETAFRVDTMDDENSVTFELESPTEKTRLVRQMEFRLQPDQQAVVPITATPRSFRMIGVGTHLHSLTLTTSMPIWQETPRSVLAQLRNRPIVGPWFLFMLGILAAIMILVTFRPRIDSFAFAPGTAVSTTTAEAVPAEDTGGTLAQGAAALQGKKIFGLKIPKLPKQLSFIYDYLPGGATGEAAPASAALTAAMVDAGNDVVLTWETRWANSLTIEKLTAAGSQFLATIDDPGRQRQYSFRAETREAATYLLTAHNWIERLPMVGATFGRDEDRLGLIVDPVQPVIEVFNVDPQVLVTGQPVNITWQVARAQEYELVVNGVPRPLSEPRGSIQESPAASSEYRLAARSPYWDDTVLSAPVLVAVSLPTPVIRNFDVAPRPIVDGDRFVVNWEVTGADTVAIDPLPGPVPNLQGQEEATLEPGKSQQTFTLLASLGEGAVKVQARATRVIEIATPTPTQTATPTSSPTPTPTLTPIPTPVIKTFDVQPRPIIDGQNVMLSWTVEGASSVEINPGMVGGLSLEGQNEIQIAPGKSQETFVLRAVASDGTSTVEARATRVVPVVTQTPTVTPTPTPSPTLTPQIPVIQVFELVPSEVIRGSTIVTTTSSEGTTTIETDLPKLTWTVVGEATNIEISGPDYGPVRNLPKQGTLRVPADKTTVFQLNVYLGDEIVTSQTQELTVIEPTPTPTLTPTLTPSPTSPPPPSATPTPTFTPTPNIVAFTVSAAEEGGQVIPVTSEDDVPTYQLEAGTAIRLNWRIENPITAVRLTDSQNDYGVRSPEDEFQATVTQSTIFRLQVAGAGDSPQLYERRIRLNVLPIEPPPPPFNVSGIEESDIGRPVTVTWSYSGEDQNSIVGFRVYRANVDNFNFSRVATEFELDNTQTQWTDTTTPSCDRVYYVVAVYEDITRSGDDRIQETETSPTSWYTKQCP